LTRWNDFEKSKSPPRASEPMLSSRSHQQQPSRRPTGRIRGGLVSAVVNVNLQFEILTQKVNPLNGNAVFGQYKKQFPNEDWRLCRFTKSQTEEEPRAHRARRAIYAQPCGVFAFERLNRRICITEMTSTRGECQTKTERLVPSHSRAQVAERKGSYMHNPVKFSCSNTGIRSYGLRRYSGIRSYGLRKWQTQEENIKQKPKVRCLRKPTEEETEREGRICVTLWSFLVSKNGRQAHLFQIK
jgi:hypothetical protein